MKSYLITNPNADAYEQRIKAFVTLPRTGSGRREDVSEAPVVLDSRERFDEAVNKLMFTTPSSTDTVFIVPELFWRGYDGIDAGYRIALELFEGKLQDNFFNLVFVSFYRRDQLCRMVGPEFIGFVRSFPHLSLQDLAEPGTEMPVPAYTKVHFELLKRVVVSQSGRIDYLAHTLSHLTEMNVNSAVRSIGRILEVLSIPAYRGQDDDFKDSLADIRQRAADAFTSQDIRDLADRLNLYLDRLKTAMSPKSSTTAGPLNYRVLIIEDDPEYREKMLEFFRERFLYVDAFDNKAIVDGKESIAKVANKYHLLIMDLMYTETGKEEDYLVPFSGLDLLGRLRLEEMGLSGPNVSEKRRMEAVPKTAVRIVSALPRNVISRLVELYLGNESPVVFTKGNGWEQLRGCLNDRMDEMIDECIRNEEEYHRNQEIPAPDAGVFGNPGMRDVIIGNPEKLSLAMDYARKVAEGELKMDEKSFALISPGRAKDPDELLGHLNATLAHRRLVINYVRTQSSGGLFDEVAYRDFLKEYVTDASIALLYQKKPRRYTKSYLTTKLGFNITEGELDSQASFSCYIDMKDKGCFFDGELAPSKGKIIPNPETGQWVQEAVSLLEEKVRHDGAYGEDFRQAGVLDFLAGDDRSIEAFLALIERVNGYLDDGTAAYESRDNVWTVFNEVIQDDLGFAGDYKVHKAIRQCSLALLDHLKRFINE